MNKIEQIEALLEGWKEAREAAISDGLDNYVLEYTGIIRGLTAALRILDQPKKEGLDGNRLS